MTYWYVVYNFEIGNVNVGTGASVVTCGTSIFNLSKFKKSTLQSCPEKLKASNVVIVNFIKLSKEEYEQFNS